MSVEELPSANDDVTRRRAMQIGVGAAALATGVGTASAQSDDNTFEVDVDSDDVHDVVIEGEITVDEHDGSNMDVLGYLDDNEESGSLRDLGVVPRALDNDEEAEHWVEYAPGDVRSPKYSNFPRGVSYQDADDNEVEVSWTDPTEWSDATDLTEEDGGVRFAPGATSTFESTADWDLNVSNSLSKYLFAVLDIDTLNTGGVATITLEDDTGATVSVTADPSADSTNDDVIATSTGQDIVYQERIGDLVNDLSNIVSVTVDLNADAEILLHGFDIEESDRVSFGTEEYIDSDDNLDTREVYDSAGGVLELSDLSTGRFVNDTINSLTYLVEQRSSGLGSDSVFGRATEADMSRFDQPVRMEVIYSMEFPTGFYLESTVNTAYVDTQLYSESRYREALRLINEDVGSIADWDDVSDSATEITSRFADYDNSITVYDSLVAGDELAFGLEYLVSEDVASNHEIGAVGAVGISGGGGGFFGGARGIILAISGILGAWAARTRGLFGG